MKVEYEPYRAKKILNVHKHIDGAWFWDKYSAYPYIGCEHACEYCYNRADKYLHHETPADFSRIIKVKINAAELLRKELAKVPKELITTGDYQPAELEFGLSRKMLEVVRDLGFPVFILEKSDLVLRDLDIIKEINQRSYACVSFSINTTDDNLAKIFEPGAPPPTRRFEAMKTLAGAGIYTGTTCIPVLPFISDSEENIEQVVLATKEAGGQFVIAGGLTLENNVATRYYRLLRERFPRLVEKYNAIYFNRRSPDAKKYYRECAQKVKRYCLKHGLSDRIRRYIPKGPLAMNKKIAEIFHLTAYYLDIEGGTDSRVWAFRKAAWAIDELKEDIYPLYQENRLHSIPACGPKIVAAIIKIIENKKVLTETERFLSLGQ